MCQNKSKPEVTIHPVLVKFGSFKVLSCQFGIFCLSSWAIWIQRNVKYKFPLRTFYCHSSTSLTGQDYQSCFINRWTSQFGNFWLCEFVELCDLSFYEQVFPHSAGPMFWWMPKILMTNELNDSRAAGPLNSAVQIKSPWRRISRLNSNNRTFRAYIHWCSPSIGYDF